MVVRRGRPLIGAPVLACLLALLGVTAVSCGTSTPTPGPGATVAVVTSTNVWGDIARQVGGDRVSVTSLISDPAADPHSYEANAQNQLSVSRAAVVIENGGGYDDFVDRMISSTRSGAVLLNAVQLSGLKPQGGEFDEHVWYDFPTATRVADRLAAELGRADPTHAGEYISHAATFDRAVNDLIRQEAAARPRVGGVGVAITEPVPLYLLNAVGAVDRTPADFSKAIENETDVPATALASTLALFTGHTVKALVYNEQTTGPQTDLVLASARAAGVPVVGVSETLPAGKDYQSWMKANVTAVVGALS